MIEDVLIGAGIPIVQMGLGTFRLIYSLWLDIDVLLQNTSLKVIVLTSTRMLDAIPLSTMSGLLIL